MLLEKVEGQIRHDAGLSALFLDSSIEVDGNIGVFD